MNATFFSGLRKCLIFPFKNSDWEFSVKKEGLILALSKSIFGLIVYSTKDPKGNDNIYMKFPFINTEIYVSETGDALGIKLFDDNQIRTSYRHVKFRKIYNEVINEPNELIEEIKNKPLKKEIYFKLLDSKPIFYLPNAKPILPM